MSSRTDRRQRLLRRLRRIRRWLTWRTEHTWFYNLDNYRPDAQVAAELRALASTDPATIDLCEVIGNELPGLRGYTLVRDRGNRSRQNIACYVRADLPLRGHRWIDLEGTWPRTKGAGTHEPRSYLELQLGRMQKIVAHQPPKNARNAWTLQHEGINALVPAMAPWTRRGWRRSRSRAARVIARLRPRQLTWDANRRSGEAGPGPDTLAARIGGTVHGGERIDSELSRGQIEVLDVDKHHRVAGVELESDHRGAIRIRWRVRSYWLPESP